LIAVLRDPILYLVIRGTQSLWTAFQGLPGSQNVCHFLKGKNETGLALSRIKKGRDIGTRQKKGGEPIPIYSKRCTAVHLLEQVTFYSTPAPENTISTNTVAFPVIADNGNSGGDIFY
jgi:hypothetical protein